MWRGWGGNRHWSKKVGMIEPPLNNGQYAAKRENDGGDIASVAQVKS
jgi:hypothetical protein